MVVSGREYELASSVSFVQYQYRAIIPWWLAVHPIEKEVWMPTHSVLTRKIEMSQNLFVQGKTALVDYKFANSVN